MQSNMDKDLAVLEKDIGAELRCLPQVYPSEEFEQRLWNDITAMQKQKATAHRVRSGESGKAQGFWKSSRISRASQIRLVAAVLLVVLAGSWLGGFFRQKDQAAGLGPLFIPTAYAQTAYPGELSFRLGTQNSLQNIEFIVKESAEMKALPRELPAQRLQKQRLSVDDALELARRLGMEDDALVMGADDAEPRWILIEGQSTLWYDLRFGSWWYEKRPDTEKEDTDLYTGKLELGRETARQAALKWLDEAGLLPDDPYVVESQADNANYWIDVRPVGLDEQPVFGSQPGYRLYVTADGKVTYASGKWYQAEETFSLPVLDWDAAVDALKNGEGEFICAGFTPYDSGTALVSGARTGYQLAFALDYTPYYVPVLVFTGEYQGEKGESGSFTAYVPLVKYESRDNAGNFTLQTELPQAREQVATLQERPLAVSESEIPALAAFFGMADAQRDEYGVLEDGKGSRLSATSWNKGWLWRGKWQSDQVTGGPISKEQAYIIAQDLAEKLPVLPGELGEFRLQDMSRSGEGFYSLIAPFLYDGLPVEDCETSASPRSCLGVQIDKQTGDVTTVHCALPMSFRDEECLLITPEEAWGKLLKNEGVVYLQDWGNAIFAERFLVDASLITEVKLIYMPRDPNFARNEFYDLKYCFHGVAELGEQKIPFSVIVDAEK